MRTGLEAHLSKQGRLKQSFPVPQLPKMEKREFIERATRFPIQTLILYRIKGAKDWNRGKTIDISRTGVLFLAEKDFETKSRIEMLIVFDGLSSGITPANIKCWGTMVRKEAAADPGSKPKVAAVISNYRFVPRPEQGASQ